MDAGRSGRDLGEDFEEDLLGVWMRGVLQMQHLPTAVVITDDAGEAHDGTGGVVGDQLLMRGQQDRILGDGRPDDTGHWWSPPDS